MKTLKSEFNRLKKDIDFSDCERDHTLAITIREKYWNETFTSCVTRIASDGKIYSRQFEDSHEISCTFDELANKESKLAVLDLLTNGNYNYNEK